MKKRAFMFFIIPIIVFLLAELYLRCFSNYNECYFDYENKIIKRKKNTHGRYKTKYTSTGYFNINNDGWNSWRDYLEGKVQQKCRIAIVGHSNVEGLRVHVTKLFSKVLEDKLVENSKDTEVYTFGFGGMHLAQALHVSRYVAKKYNPDILIIGTMSDDFLYDYSGYPNFLSLKVTTEGKIEEILPSKIVEDSPFSFLYFLGVMKYIDTKFEVGKKFKRAPKIQRIDSIYNNTTQKRIQQQYTVALDYILHEFFMLQNKFGHKTFFINFPDRVPLYNGLILSDTNYMVRQNKLIGELKRYPYRVIDLRDVFVNDYKQNGKKFDFPNDTHYNEYAHHLIGLSLGEYFIEKGIKKNDE